MTLIGEQMEEMSSLHANKESEAYRIADQRVRAAIAGLYTANPPLDLPALDSDRSPILGRLTFHVHWVDSLSAMRLQSATTLFPRTPIWSTMASASAGIVAVSPSAERAAATEPARVVALDGLRGIAVLLVLQGHFTASGNTLFDGGARGIDRGARGIDRGALIISSWGWIGVDLFLVLSGFLITGILFDAKAGAPYFRNFYARRVLRIFPLYYGYLAIIFLIMPLVFPVDWNAPLKHQIWYWLYVPDLRAVLQKSVVEYPFHGVVGHLWSLAIEEQFYLVWPAVVLVLGRRHLLLACAGVVVASFAFRAMLIAFDVDGAANYTLLPGRMGSLAVGAAIALVARSDSGFAAFRRWLVPVAAGSAAGILAIIAIRHGFDPGDPWVQLGGYTLLGLFFGAAVAAGASGEAGRMLDRVLTNPMLTACGRYSYALYVLQGVAILFVRWRFDEAGGLPLLAGSRLPAVLFFSLVTGALTFAAAWLSWHVYENQFLKLKRYFPRAAAPATPAASATAPLAVD